MESHAKIGALLLVGVAVGCAAVVWVATSGDLSGTIEQTTFASAEDALKLRNQTSNVTGWNETTMP